MKKIRLFIVDDSMLFMFFFVRVINSDPEIEVVGTAKDPFEAKDAIMKFKPDVMTLDVEMPRMNGIEFLRQLLPQYKLPVVMVSSLNEVVFDALSVGAVDFVTKPTALTAQNIEEFVRTELAAKIKAAAHSKLTIGTRANTAAISQKMASANTAKARNSKIRVIAIGASTGGTEAILSVLSQLSPDVPGIVVTQHMPPGFTTMYAKRLNTKCSLNVKEAETGDIILPGRVLLAPGSKQMTVYKDSDSLFKVKCFQGAKVSGHCPSVDVLFNSVAENVKSNAIGVILTGMGADGATGLLLMRTKGAETIGQNEESCVVYGMPKVAYQTGAVKYQLPLNAIPKKIYQLLDASKK